MPASRPAPPAADLPVDRERVRHLLTQLVPEPGVRRGSLDVDVDLAPRPAGEGWDNVLWPVGTVDGLPVVLRVVRRRSARPLRDRELAVLRRLAPLSAELPLRIPTILASAPDALLIRWVPGRSAAESSPPHRRRSATGLASMLAALHSLPPRDLADLERNPVRGVPLASRAEALAADLERAELPADLRRAARDVADRGLEAPVWDGEDRLLHGDPHPGNVVVPTVDPDRDPAPDEDHDAVRDRARTGALIDWGDATLGDPASDLGALLLHDPRGNLLARYRRHATWNGIEDEALWSALLARARAWSVRLSLALVTAYDSAHPLGRSGTELLRAVEEGELTPARRPGT